MEKFCMGGLKYLRAGSGFIFALFYLPCMTHLHTTAFISVYGGCYLVKTHLTVSIKYYGSFSINNNLIGLISITIY